eukprot:m.1305 g.1305  ORF g.1305 m.1305 type:complete len:192 (+) comp6058_c0_seq1:59-634(+)
MTKGALFFVGLLHVILLSRADPIPTLKQLDLIQDKPSREQTFDDCVVKCVGLSPETWKRISACGENIDCLLQNFGGLSNVGKFLSCTRKCQANSRPSRSLFRFENAGKTIDKAIDFAGDLTSSIGQHNGFPATNFMSFEGNGFVPCFTKCLGLNSGKMMTLFLKCKFNFECYIGELGPSAAGCLGQCMGKK